MLAAEADVRGDTLMGLVPGDYIVTGVTLALDARGDDHGIAPELRLAIALSRPG